MRAVNQNGFSLIEVIVSLALLGIVGVGILCALGTSSGVLATTNELDTAKNIAQMQMDNVKNQPFNLSYTPADISTSYPGFSVEITVNNQIPQRDANIQKIEVTVEHGNTNLLTLAGYKTR